MINPAWILVILIVVIVFFVVKTVGKKQEIAVKIVLGLFFILILAAGYVYVTEDIDISSAEGIVHGFKVYFNWLGSVFKNTGKIIGYAINQDWAINATNSSG